ncbi:hypothetical protein JCM14469_32800 [Desulfatiferula olefinivorans]
MNLLTFRRIRFALVLLIGLGAATAQAGNVDIRPTHDTQAVEGYPTTNYGTRTSMYVNSATGGYRNERSWLRFDLTGQVPPGATVVNATLRLYCFSADATESLVADVHPVTDDHWDETTLTWNTQPTFGGALDSTVLEAGKRYTWYDWDVTSFVSAELPGDGDASFVVKPSVENQDPYATFAFDTKEYSGGEYAPVLRVEYSGTWPETDAFTVFHINDVHSRLTPHALDIPAKDDRKIFESVGGAAYLCARMMELKAQYPSSLILDAGDISEGNPLGDLRGNGGIVDAYNLMDSKLKALGGRGIDAVVVGNHDVRSPVMLNTMKNNTLFPCISVNIIDKTTGLPYFSPSVVVTIEGKTIGILGYTNDESSYLGEGMEDDFEIVPCVWSDADASTIDLKDKVDDLRTNQGCDIVILLSHMGHTRVCTGDDALIRDTGDVTPPELVVAGHWHTWTETVWQPAQLNGKTLIAEAASYMQYIGEVRLSGTGKYLEARKHVIRCEDITPDPDMEVLVQQRVTEYETTHPDGYGLFDIVGYSATDLTMDKDKWWTLSEFPWNGDNTAGAWVCDAMVWKAEQLGSPCALALQSGGGIRRDVPKGPVTFIQIYETYPWEEDAMVRIDMTGQQILTFIENDSCGTSLSRDWQVTADDGIISRITYQGSDISPTGTYSVVISEYMYAHGTWSDTTPDALNVSIRNALVEYTAQFTEASPMTVPGPRYILDTELAGGFRAVVTMMADTENEPYYEAAFIRLLSATDETLARRNGYGLSTLVRSDGSIHADHQFSETMLYRSPLGFKDGYLKPGDIIEVWGEGGFYGGNPQFVDQDGIKGPDTEFTILGHDESLSRPVYHPSISSFWNDRNENHHVVFYAEKTGTNTVRDSDGTQITVYQPGGYYTLPLPGSVGDILELSGVNTYRFSQRRFRCGQAATASSKGITGYPPSSRVEAVTPYQNTTSVTLFVSASDADGTVGSVTVYHRYSPDQVTWTDWTSDGQVTAGSLPFAFPEGYGYYEFHSAATDNLGNLESAPVTADASARYRDGQNDAPSGALDSGIPNGQTDVDLSPALSVTVSDPDGDSMNVSFYAVTASGDVLIGSVPDVASGQTATVFWTGLENATRYEWYVITDDGVSQTVTTPWSFSTPGYEEPDPPEPPESVPAAGPLGLLLLFLLLALFGRRQGHGRGSLYFKDCNSSRE